MKMRDADSKEQFLFTHNKLIECTAENPTGLVELPAIRPDLAPLQGNQYTIYHCTMFIVQCSLYSVQWIYIHFHGLEIEDWGHAV